MSGGGGSRCLPSKLDQRTEPAGTWDARQQGEAGMTRPIKNCTFAWLCTGTHALIWAQQLSGLFRVCVIMTPGFASAASRKLSIWGGGGRLARNGKGMGRPKVREYALSGHSGAGRGEAKGRRLEGRAGPGAKVSEGGQRAGQGSQGSHCPLPWGHAPSRTAIRLASPPTATPMGILFAQGPSWAPGPRATAQCPGGPWTPGPIYALMSCCPDLAHQLQAARG